MIDNITIEEQASNQYKSIDQSQLGNLVMTSERRAFKKGAEWAIEQLQPKWYTTNEKPKEGTHQVYVLDDDGSTGTMYVMEGMEEYLKDQGIVKWTYLPELPKD